MSYHCEKSGHWANQCPGCGACADQLVLDIPSTPVFHQSQRQQRITTPSAADLVVAFLRGEAAWTDGIDTTLSEFAAKKMQLAGPGKEAMDYAKGLDSGHHVVTSEQSESSGRL